MLNMRGSIKIYWFWEGVYEKILNFQLFWPVASLPILNVMFLIKINVFILKSQLALFVPHYGLWNFAWESLKFWKKNTLNILCTCLFLRLTTKWINLAFSFMLQNYENFLRNSFVWLSTTPTPAFLNTSSFSLLVFYWILTFSVSAEPHGHWIVSNLFITDNFRSQFKTQIHLGPNRLSVNVMVFLNTSYHSTSLLHLYNLFSCKFLPIDLSL